jgi:hypothetical protein
LKRNFLIPFVFGAVLAVTGASSFAHHGAASYDVDKKIVLKGTVTQYLWANPHVLMQVDAAAEGGQTVHWVVETENPSAMVNRGWSKDSMKTGDQVTLTVTPVRNGRPYGRIIDVLLPSGQKLQGPHIADADTPHEAPGSEAPRQ